MLLSNFPLQYVLSWYNDAVIRNNNNYSFRLADDLTGCFVFKNLFSILDSKEYSISFKDILYDTGDFTMFIGFDIFSRGNKYSLGFKLVTVAGTITIYFGYYDYADVFVPSWTILKTHTVTYSDVAVDLNFKFVCEIDNYWNGTEIVLRRIFRIKSISCNEVDGLVTTDLCTSSLTTLYADEDCEFLLFGKSDGVDAFYTTLGELAIF